MHLADHIRPLLRDHDCVIIPDFGGLVADASSARAQPGRQALSPPTKLVAFNQALTRNDGLLVDALSAHLGMSIAQARETVRTAVADLQRELDETNRTELPGIGIFRRAVGRGLAFEYTGTDNLLASAFGLPELAARPVRAADARSKNPQPVLRSGNGRRTTLARLLPASVMAVAAGLLLLVNYQVALKAGYLPVSWQAQAPQWGWTPRNARPVAVLITEPQEATLGQHDFRVVPDGTEGMRPLETPVSIPEMASTVAVTPEVAAELTPAAAAASAPIVAAPAAAPVPATAPGVALVAAAAKPPVAAPAARPIAIAPAKVAVAAVAAPAPITPAVAKAPVAPAFSTIIKARTGRYYVIAGAYSTLPYAEKGRKVLAKTGHPARIILPPFGSRLFRLSAADYPDLASAQREALRLRLSTHCDYITLKF